MAGSGGRLKQCAPRSVSEPLNHKHQPTCGWRSLWYDRLCLRRVKGTLDEECANTWETVTRAQSASPLSVAHGSPTFPMVRSVPQVGQREETSSQSPGGLPPLLLVSSKPFCFGSFGWATRLIHGGSERCRYSTEAEWSQGCFPKPPWNSRSFREKKLRQLMSWDSEPIHSPDGKRAPIRWMGA